MNNQSIKIIVRAQTVDEEFDYLMNTLHKMDFYTKYGYKIPIPNHPLFLTLADNLDLLKSIDIKKIKSTFKSEIYNTQFFEKGIKTIKTDIGIVEKALKKIQEWEQWGFKLFPKYEIKLTAYGPGGTYKFKEGEIIIKTKENGKFDRIPYHTIIHEIIHIGIELSIVKRFGLTHNEKEGLVDSICVNCFSDLLLDYKIQDFGDKNIFNLISTNNIMNLSEIIQTYKQKKFA